MTDTGQIPGEGLPENAGADTGAEALLPPHTAFPGNGVPQQPDWGTEPVDDQTAPEYAYLDHPAPPGAQLDDDEDDVLLMPGTQGSWSDPQPVPPPAPVPAQQQAPHLLQQPVSLHQPSVDLPISVEVPVEVPLETVAPPMLGNGAQVFVAQQPQQVRPQPVQPQPAPVQPQQVQPQPQQVQAQQVPAQPAGAGPDASGSPAQPAAAQADPVDGVPAQPQPAAAGWNTSAEAPPAPQQPAVPRRPLHMGPPVPDTPSGGVSVRSLADRGPAVTVPGPATSGPEYLDVPRDDANGIPAQQTGEPGGAAVAAPGSPWPAAPGGASQQSLIPRADSVPRPAEPAAPAQDTAPAPQAPEAAAPQAEQPQQEQPQQSQQEPAQPAQPPAEAAQQDAVQPVVQSEAAQGEVPPAAEAAQPAAAEAPVETQAEPEPAAEVAAQPQPQAQPEAQQQPSAPAPQPEAAAQAQVPSQAAAPVEPAPVAAPEPAQPAAAAPAPAEPAAPPAPEPAVPAQAGPAASPDGGLAAPQPPEQQVQAPPAAPEAAAAPASETVAEAGPAPVPVAPAPVPADEAGAVAPAEEAAEPVQEQAAAEQAPAAAARGRRGKRRGAPAAEQAAEQPVPEEAASDQPAPEQAVPDQVTPEQAVPDQQPEPQPVAPQSVPEAPAGSGAEPGPEPVPAPVADAGPAPAAPEPAVVPAAPEPVAAEAVPVAQEAPADPAVPGAVPAPELVAAADGPVAPAQPEAPAAPEPAPAAAREPAAAKPVPQGPPAEPYDPAVRDAVHRVIRERRDIRNGFRPDPIPHDVLLRVLEAAHTAPSVGHSQPWDFVVIRSEKTREKMHELAMAQRDAYAKSLPKARARQFRELKIEAILDTPVNIVVTADPTRGGRHTLGRHTQPQMAPYSSALAVENLWIAARAEGLGVGWVSFFDERQMVSELGLPEHLEVVAYLCVGYVDEFPEEPELMQAGWSQRRPLSWVVHEEEYGNRALPGEEPHDLLEETLRGIRPLDAKALGEAWERQKRMTKPAGALGMLEIISAQLSGLSRQCPPPIPEPAAVAVFAGDHGVHAQGVTAWPQEVTGQMVANILGGGAVCNAFANQVGAEVCVIDVGVASELPATAGLLPRKVRPGTADFTAGPAMSREEVLKAIEVGIDTARDLVSAGNKALLTGEMGIANTTASAAIVAVYTGADPAEVTGRGTGINDEMHARKIDVVRRALELHRPDPQDPISVLAAVGGLEHAAMVGLLLGAAALRTPVVLDGVSAGAAALVARAIAPEVLAACIAGHRSAEPGHVAALTTLGLRPLVDLDLRLGEGTGALLALPLVQSAARVMHEVATFDAAGVTEKG
ncbi:putative nicotinate-nucleotide-dimethylbenzimidazole phosphoribosyltransferase [Actinacidiphila reveromycinica]|uniref:Nicotinate-nucleotide--dimethylbenzimidazole phosphoribosyltransferase n=1 Tax=Actinacidiphila reveromycinica TaxID=659352 RepID=A0A7U3UP01_9ACTN|nr:nicotinate-nucleotide--dimethylbenzimidazole phosphoribosyltransferase [Streptomyces sp. SN-593]BBA96068.1 putative nicotinate-nucleotide-dimethylbenzimidazole phosphoribosyltransferase [Streptomyces sp. SN-593]